MASALPRPTLPKPSEGITTGKPYSAPLSFKMPRLPRVKMPRLLDADDQKAIAGAAVKLALYTVLVMWTAVVLALALGLAVRLFLFIGFGG